MITIQIKKLDELINPQGGYIIYVYHDKTKIEAEITNKWEYVIDVVDKFKKQYSPHEIIFFDWFDV